MTEEISGIITKDYEDRYLKFGKNLDTVSNLKIKESISKYPDSLDSIKLKEACTQFEQIFVKYMVDKMWSGVDAIRGEQSTEKEIWQDYFNNEISKTIAESNLTGLAESLYLQLSPVLLKTTEEETAAAEIIDGEKIIEKTGKQEKIEAFSESSDTCTGENIVPEPENL
jgi:Rod binding domain-containing protein